jgi:hypothetical protein
MPNASHVGHGFAYDTTWLNLRHDDQTAESCLSEGLLSRGDIAFVVATGERRTFGIALIRW